MITQISKLQPGRVNFFAMVDTIRDKKNMQFIVRYPPYRIPLFSHKIDCLHELTLILIDIIMNEIFILCSCRAIHQYNEFLFMRDEYVLYKIDKGLSE